MTTEPTLKDAGYELADDFDRISARATRRAPAIDAVIEGHTVFIAGLQSAVAGRFKRATKGGYRVHTRKGERNGVAGVYVWRESTDGKNGTS